MADRLTVALRLEPRPAEGTEISQARINPALRGQPPAKLFVPSVAWWRKNAPVLLRGTPMEALLSRFEALKEVAFSLGADASMMEVVSTHNAALNALAEVDEQRDALQARCVRGLHDATLKALQSRGAVEDATEDLVNSGSARFAPAVALLESDHLWLTTKARELEAAIAKVDVAVNAGDEPPYTMAEIQELFSAYAHRRHNLSDDVRRWPMPKALEEHWPRIADNVRSVLSSTKQAEFDKLQKGMRDALGKPKVHLGNLTRTI